MTASDVESYVSERVQGQIDYHDQRALESQRRFRRLTVLSITASSLTPLLIALEIIISPPPLDEPAAVVFKILPIVAAVLAAIAAVSLAAFKHRESWITHRSACELLKREVQLFRYGAGPYAEAQNTRALFVERAEALMESEGREWKRLYAADSEASRGNQTT